MEETKDTDSPNMSAPLKNKVDDYMIFFRQCSCPPCREGDLVCLLLPSRLHMSALREVYFSNNMLTISFGLGI
jgi:hypothetical protein